MSWPVADERSRTSRVKRVRSRLITYLLTWIVVATARVAVAVIANGSQIATFYMVAGYFGLIAEELALSPELHMMPRHLLGLPVSLANDWSFAFPIVLIVGSAVYAIPLALIVMLINEHTD